MKRPLLLILSLGLAGGLWLGGFTGLSPALHQWLEHGGRGPVHVHHGNATPGAGVEKGLRTAAPATQPVRIAILPAAQRAHAFVLPSISITRLWHRFLRVLGDWAEAPPESDAPGFPVHHHDSLAQTLLTGLLDVAPTAIVGPGFAVREFALPPAADVFPLRGVFGPHAFERGPPACAS